MRGVRGSQKKIDWEMTELTLQIFLKEKKGRRKARFRRWISEQGNRCLGKGL